MRRSEHASEARDADGLPPSCFASQLPLGGSLLCAPTKQIKTPIREERMGVFCQLNQPSMTSRSLKRTLYLVFPVSVMMPY